MACCRCWHAACRRVGGRRARTTGWRRASGAGGDAQCKCMAGVGGGSGRGGGHHFPARGWWPCVDSRHPPGHDGGPYNRLCGDADCVSCDSRGRGRGWRCRRARPRRWPLPAAADRRRLCQRRGGDGGGPGRSVGPVLAPARRRGCARDALWRRRLVDDGQRGGKCARWGGGGRLYRWYRCGRVAGRHRLGGRWQRCRSQQQQGWASALTTLFAVYVGCRRGWLRGAMVSGDRFFIYWFFPS